MKVKPVVDALDKAGARTSLVHTGQHYDPAMSDVFFEELGIREPEFHLGVGSGSHAEHTSRVMVAFERLIAERGVDAAIVAGDVNSTLACALVGAKAGVLVGHVEAGLRSRDWTMPEEVNRVVVDRVSDLLFAPSPDAVENLLSEGYRDDQIHLVGNVMIDTLLANQERAVARTPWLRFGLDKCNYGVVTLHRPSNVDDTETLKHLVGTLQLVATKLPLVFPVHPRTRNQLGELLATDTNIVLTEPMGYLDFLGLVSAARVVLTDSGGVQEETTALGVPCLTVRENTERPITITSGTNRLVGRDRTTILAGVADALAGQIKPRCPELWDGRAAERIAEAILGLPTGFRRPTER